MSASEYTSISEQVDAGGPSALVSMETTSRHEMT